MAALIYADTHVVAWLYAGRTDLIPSRARALIEDQPLLVSPMVALELEYLFETGRTSEPARSVIQALGRALGLRLCDLPFADVAGAAVRQSWTRDPFDRIIVAQAALRRAPLITRDADIRAHYPRALWGR
ncbi:MAG: type II toxin-antitoxin system VapC family toxin [Candidatus Rokuibacteriota bacterium]